MELSSFAADSHERKPEKKVSFSHDAKPDRDIIPGYILGIMVNMHSNGIYPKNFRSALELFKTLTDDQDKLKIFVLLFILIKNMQEKLKENNSKECSIECSIDIPVCMSGSSMVFVNINRISSCIDLLDQIEYSNFFFRKIRKQLYKNI